MLKFDQPRERKVANLPSKETQTQLSPEGADKYNNDYYDDDDDDDNELPSGSSFLPCIMYFNVCNQCPKQQC